MAKKLNFELVPDSCWYSNLRSILSKKQWDFLRKEAYEKANSKCMICSKPSKRLEAHEQWSYNEKDAVQKLEGIIAVCHNCHSVIHIGRTGLVGDIEKAEKHYMKVNKCSYSEYVSDLGKANETHKRLNNISEWKIDLSYLKRYVKE